MKNQYSHDFPSFRKTQGDSLAIDNLVDKPLSFLDIAGLQAQQTWLDNITASTYRATTYTDEEKEAHTLDEAYREKQLNKATGSISSYIARGTGWVAGTLGDPTDLALLVFSGGVANIATKPLSFAQKGLAKRLMQGSVMGATYGLAKEPLLHLDKDVDQSLGASAARVAETTVAFPLLGEVAHQGGKVFKNIFLKKTNSAFLDEAYKVEALNNTASKNFVDESLSEFKTSFSKDVQNQVNSIVERTSDLKNGLESAINDVGTLQELKSKVREDWGNTRKVFREINQLEDKISQGLTQEEELALVNLKETYAKDLVIRDNQQKLLDILIVNRQIIAQQEEHAMPAIAGAVEYQLENGKQINPSIKHKTVEGTESLIRSKDLQVSQIKEIKDYNVKIDPLLQEEMPELANAIKILDSAPTSTFGKDIADEIVGINNIYKKQLALNQIAGENLYKELATYKDLNTGLRVVTNRIGNESSGYFALASNKIYSQLKEKKLLEFFEKGGKYWGQELAILNKASLPSTNMQSAKDVAKILHESNAIVLRRAKAAGIDINELAGRIIKQTHSKDKIKQDGFSKWHDFITPLLDTQKTDTSIGAMQKTYQKLTHPHLEKEAVIRPLLGNEKVQEILYSLGVNIGKKKSRSLHFKSLDSAHLYNSKYGINGWSKQYITDLQALTENTIKAEQLGLHPEHTLRYVRNKLSKEGVDVPENFVNTILSPLRLNSEKAIRHDNYSLWGDRVRAYTGLCMLGKSALSSLPDLFTTYMASRVIGSSRTNALGGVFKGLAYLINPKERKKSLELTNVVIEGALADMYNRLGMEVVKTGSNQGVLTKATHLLYKVNGQSLWDSALKTGMAEGTAKYIGDSLNKSWESLPTALKSIFQENGITPKEFSTLRNTPLVDGFLLPFKIQSEELATKYQGFLIDTVNRGITTGTRATDQYLMQGHKISQNSPLLREFATSWLQFKHFPIMFCRYMLAPMFRANTPLQQQQHGALGAIKDLSKTPSLLPSLAILITGTISLEYIAKELKAVVAGKKSIEDTFNPTETEIKDIAMHGAALGIYQSLLSSMASSSPLDNPFTPAAYSPFKKAVKIGSSIGDKDFIPTLIHQGSQSIPYNNLFYTEYLLKKNINQYLQDNYPVYAKQKKLKNIYKKH